MREFKFRAWDEKKEIMYMPDIAGLYLTLECEFNSVNENHNLIGTKNTPQFILLQYTGLKDSEGKEIYEGDVVKFDHKYKMYPEIFKIIWFENNFGFGAEYTDGDTYALNTMIEGATSNVAHLNRGIKRADIKIIGNIYENPELLQPAGGEGEE